MTTRNFSIALALLVVVAAAGWQYTERKHRAERQAIAALAADGTAQLRNSLSADGSAQAAPAIESDLASLRDLRASRERAGAEVAEQYLVSARAIAQRR